MSLSRICYMHETEHSASHGDECNYRRWLTPEHAPTHTLHTHTQRNSNKYKYNTYQQTTEKKKQKKMLLEAMQKIILKFAPRHLCGAGENVICHAYIHLQGLSGVLLLSLLLLLVPSLLFYFLFLFFHSLRWAAVCRFVIVMHVDFNYTDALCWLEACKICSYSVICIVCTTKFAGLKYSFENDMQLGYSWIALGKEWNKI